MRERRHRLRVLLADNRTVILLLLVVGVGLGAAVTYTTHISPGTTTEERAVSSWESTGDFTHRATVLNDTDVYPEGTTLRGRSAYFREVTPELDGEFAYRYTATDGGNLTVETDTTLVLRSVDTDQANGSVYWRSDEPLSTTTERSVGPDDTVGTAFSLNVSEVDRRIQTIDEQFGGTPGEKQLLVVTEVAVSGSRNGQPVDLTRRYRLRITPEGSLYRVAEPGSSTNSRSQTDSIVVPAEYGPARSLGGPALLGLGLAGICAFVAQQRYTPPVTDTERQWVQYRQIREEFDDWITQGEIPAAAEGPPTVTVDTLSGLVDLAIDTGERVVEDERRGACLVLQDNRWYLHEMPPEPAIGEAAIDVSPADIFAASDEDGED